MRITTINAAIVVMGIILVGTQALPLLKEDSDETEPDFFKRMKDICDDIRTRKIKKDESVIEMNGRKCRVAFITNQAFFVQRDMSRAFVATPEQVRAEVRNPHARQYQLTFLHPLGKLEYCLDARSTERLRGWLENAPQV